MSAVGFACRQFFLFPIIMKGEKVVVIRKRKQINNKMETDNEKKARTGKGKKETKNIENYDNTK